MFNILVPINQSPLTAIESVEHRFEVGNRTVFHLKDTYNRHRFIVTEGETVIAAILFEEPTEGYKEVEVGCKETDENYRRQGLQNELWKYAAYRLALYNLTPIHSENLTELGRLSIRSYR